MPIFILSIQRPTIVALNSELISDDVDLIEKILVLPQDLLKLLAGIEDCGVVPSGEYVSDPLKRVVHMVLEKIHGDLSWNHVLLLSVFSEEILLVDGEMLADRFNEVLVALYCYLLRLIGAKELICDRKLVQPCRDIIYGWRDIMELIFCDDLIQDSLKLTDIRACIVGDEFGDFLGDDEFPRSRFLLEDREPCLEIGHGDIDDDPPLEAASESWLKL